MDMYKADPLHDVIHLTFWSSFTCCNHMQAEQTGLHLVSEKLFCLFCVCECMCVCVCVCVCVCFDCLMIGNTLIARLAIRLYVCACLFVCVCVCLHTLLSDYLVITTCVK